MATKRMARLFLGTLGAVVVLTGGLLSTGQQKVSAACAALPTDKGTVTQSVSLGAGNYTIWSRIRTDTPANNSFYMSIDGSGNNNLLCGATIGGNTLPANTWTWVKYTSTVNVTANTAGNYTMTMAGKDDNVEVDRVILTGDNSCVPDNTAVAIGGVNYYGENCAPTDTTAPVVTVTAPTPGSTLSGTTTNVTGSVSDASTLSNLAVYVDGSSTPAATASSFATGNYSIPLNLTSFASGSSHTLVVKATDAEDNTGASSSVSFTMRDTAAPVISAISSGSISQTTATVSWTTNEAADSQVEYGTTTAYGSSTTLNSSKLTAHSVSLTGLTASTTYHYRVKSTDASGNAAMSADNTFTTSAPAADTTPPTVSILTPTPNATVSSTVILTASASDASGIAGVQFKVNGTNVGSEITTYPYVTNWDTTGLTNGTYKVTALARDSAGNTKLSTAVSVTVSNSTAIPEDIDQSGHVNGADYAILASNFNMTTSHLTNPRADIDGSGTVDGADFAKLASKFNQ